MNVQFQAASPDDIETLLNLVRAYYDHDEIHFDASSVRRGLAKLLGTPSLGAAWLIVDGGSLLGFFVLTFGFDLEFGGRVATVTEFYLKPPHRRKGVGTRTLTFIEETLRALGIGAFELQAEQRNGNALAFYRSFGMEAHARVPFSKRVPGGTPPA